MDDLHRGAARQLTERMMADPRAVTRCPHLMTAAKCLERVADRATAIAGEVFRLCRGEDIRHSPRPQSPG